MTGGAPAGGHAAPYDHVFLGEGHARNERRTWIVIGLCCAMMLVEIVGGLAYGSIALVADGLHMSTHAGALLLAALAYTFSRRLAHDRRFSFGTGKLGDLAGFTSAVVLAMIALLIGYEAAGRLFAPVPIRFGEAIPIAVLGLAVNLASAWLLGAGHHGQGHGHSHGHGHHDHDHGRGHDHRRDGHDHHHAHDADPVPSIAEGREAAHGVAELAVHHRDNNMRAAVVHVLADAAVSVLVIAGLVLARLFGWLWMDPVTGIVGAAVIASWSYGLLRDTGAILLDMTPDAALATRMRGIVEGEGDAVRDLHLWRLGPGHLGAIVSIDCRSGLSAERYRERLGVLPLISHLTVEVVAAA